MYKCSHCHYNSDQRRRSNFTSDKVRASPTHCTLPHPHTVFCIAHCACAEELRNYVATSLHRCINNSLRNPSPRPVRVALEAGTHSDCRPRLKIAESKGTMPINKKNIRCTTSSLSHCSVHSVCSNN